LCYLSSRWYSLLRRGYIYAIIFYTNSNVYVSNGGSWPAACGYTGPQAVCSDIGGNSLYFDNDAQQYLRIVVVMVTITGLLVLWKIFTDSTSLWTIVTRWVANKLKPRRKLSAKQASDDMTRYNRNLQLVRRTARIILHCLAVAAIFTCLGIEFYFFWDIFSGPLVVFKSWGFGQIVGIAIWVGIFMEFAYLEYSQSYRSWEIFGRD
jgi:hypothetical protein